MHALVFIILMTCVVIGFAMHSQLLRQLRARHPQVWESLGRPTLIMNNSVANGLAVQRFLWRKEFQTLGDPEFARLAERLRTFGICYLVFFGLVLVWQLIEIFAPAFRTI
jgi:hypothetical protein